MDEMNRVKEIIELRNNSEKKYHYLYNRYQEAKKRYDEIANDPKISREWRKACLTEYSKAHLNLKGFCANLVQELVENGVDIFNL